VEGAPDLVVEVLSPGNRARDRGIKSRRYAKAGVRVYWIVDPRHDLLEVYTLEGRSYRQVSVTRSPGVYESPDFPGVKIMLKEIFA
jgi:Uma2 family endonuclease